MVLSTPNNTIAKVSKPDVDETTTASQTNNAYRCATDPPDRRSTILSLRNLGAKTHNDPSAAMSGGAKTGVKNRNNIAVLSTLTPSNSFIIRLIGGDGCGQVLPLSLIHI